MSRLAPAAAAVLVFSASAAFAADLGTDAQRAEGKALYEKHCSQCHGESGDGRGPGAAFFLPRPRDFTQGKYKVRSTVSGALPTDGDIKDAIAHGLAFKPGMAYTGMPPWPRFSDEQLMNLVYYLKSFSSDFADPEYNTPKVVQIPKAPPFTEESAKKGRQIFENNECIKCHGEFGRGDGPSAPTLEDDWGFPLHPANLTKPWTFRAGSSREVLFRTISTGFNGTPMPAYADAVSVEDRWHLVNYLHSLADRQEADYNQPDKAIVVAAIAEEIDLSSLEAAEALFARSSVAHIPLSGQVIEPGRQFHPAVREVDVQAVYNKNDIAILLRWDDMQAEVSGKNGPTMEVPRFEPPAPEEESRDAEESGDPFADELAGSDPFADEAAPEADPFADEVADPFADETAGAAAAPKKAYEFSDAVAVQIPTEMPEGFKKPYFIFGDSSRSVEVWFADLAKKQGQVYIGRGSGNLQEKPDAALEFAAQYESGQWTAVFKRPRSPADALAFSEKTFVPVTFSIWDGYSEDRGNKRALSSWFELYLEPFEKPSVIKPMLINGGGLFLALLLLVGYVRRRVAAR